jgi:DNA helicase-2/ATP-dependent DNA helicase PcrA
MEDGLLPHIKSIKSGEPAELEEERRLFYVGMTRAEKRLYLTRSFRRGFWGGSEPAAPSRFISEIPRKLLQMTEKETVSFREHKTRSPHIRQTRNITSNSSQNTEIPRPLNSLETTPINNNGAKVNSRKKSTIEATTTPNLSTGDKVRHNTFGDGIIINSTVVNSDIKLTVAFDKETGIKKLLASLANLKKIHSK